MLRFGQGYGRVVVVTGSPLVTGPSCKFIKVDRPSNQGISEKK